MKKSDLGGTQEEVNSTFEIFCVREALNFLLGAIKKFWAVTLNVTTIFGSDVREWKTILFVFKRERFDRRGAGDVKQDVTGMFTRALLGPQRDRRRNAGGPNNRRTGKWDSILRGYLPPFCLFHESVEKRSYYAMLTSWEARSAKSLPPRCIL